MLEGPFYQSSGAPKMVRGKTTWSLRAGLLGAILMSGFTPAQANTFDLNLSARVDSGKYHFRESGDDRFAGWVVKLTGPDVANAITVAAGDTINASVTLDQSLTIPASVSPAGGGSVWFGISFTAPAAEGFIAYTGGSVSLSYGGNAGISDRCDNTTGFNVLGCSLWTGDTNAITFDKATFSIVVDGITNFDGVPMTVAFSSPATLQYSVRNPSPVPEPETYAMMLAGVGVLGAVARRRKLAE